MSNIHGINDYSDRRDRNAPGSLMGGFNDSGDPRQESFWNFTKNFCCPSFSFKSFIFIISLVDLIVYSITLFYGISLDPNQLLAPKLTTLDTFGMKVMNLITIRIL